ncbi:GNAT family acetyltransferase [Limnohabitans sp.]|jgi:ribosomal protein S18 acetylase RimI-like enzyme|uniref:GNAT family acetyltransferase n=1 Tax=Limnohabitans sp. TaxID=1907725 RepID=UPI00391DEE40
MEIQTYQWVDENAVVALWLSCELVRPWNDPHKDIARKMQNQPDLFLVGKLEGQIMASAMFGYEGHRGWLNYLAVAPAHRRRGYARDLMRHGEAKLAAMGCPKINLQVRSSNASVIDFYRSLGYVDDQVISLGKRLIVDH